MVEDVVAQVLGPFLPRREPHFSTNIRAPHARMTPVDVAGYLAVVKHHNYPAICIRGADLVNMVLTILSISRAEEQFLRAQVEHMRILSGRQHSRELLP